VPGETRKFNNDEDDELTHASPEITAIDKGMPRPWRIALHIIQSDNRVIFDMTGPMVVGRMVPESNVFPDIDLGPYNAEDLGVSRQHLTLSLHEDRIVLIDNDSANGTRINGERVKPQESYPIRDGDEIMMGLMALKIELLMNPFTN
jgi:pSer/pThr/pTyr-binding forkhead associated (FHA) protein